MRTERLRLASPEIESLARRLTRSPKAKNPPNPFLPPRRSRTKQPPAIEKIRAERIARNARAWRAFVARGLPAAWKFVHGRRCECPALNLEPSAFDAELGMTYTRDGITYLEAWVRLKLAAPGALKPTHCIADDLHGAGHRT